MRVLFITGEFPPMQGGVGDCTNEIARALTQRGVEVSVLTSYQSSVISSQSPVSNLQSPISNLQIFPNIKTWNWSALSHIRKIISETRADITHIQYQTGAFGMHPMINFLPRLLPPSRSPSPEFFGEQFGRGGRGVRRVVTFHDLRPMYLFPKAGALRDWVTFQLARGSDAVIATNKTDYVHLREQVRGLRKWLKLIPIGSNIAPTTTPTDFDRARVRKQLGVREDETLLVYFGFVNESKGAETLIRALYDLPKAKLLFLGGQTGASDATNIAYLQHIRKEIAHYNLTARVLWTDFLPAEQISAHFYASDMCVLPYRDGASFRRGSFMAALAHGLPIITTRPRMDAAQNITVQDEQFEFADDLDLPELRDGENVMLVPPDDADALHLAITRVQTAPGLAARLSGSARLTARAFSWDKIADEHLELYERVLRAA